MTRIVPKFDRFDFELEVDEWTNEEQIARFIRLYIDLDRDGIRAYSDEIISRMGFDKLNEAVWQVGH